MSSKEKLTAKLDFSRADLTAPDKVVAEILAQLPEETQGIISGSITEYKGHVVSYTTRSLSESLGVQKHVDIQDSLGKMGEEIKKFECCLYTKGYLNYQYRMFFMQYGIAMYPVQFILEESIAQCIREINAGYIFVCENREEVEDLVWSILNSKKILSVMQELIRIYQAQKQDT